MPVMNVRNTALPHKNYIFLTLVLLPKMKSMFGSVWHYTYIWNEKFDILLFAINTSFVTFFSKINEKRKHLKHLNC